MGWCLGGGWLQKYECLISVLKFLVFKWYLFCRSESKNLVVSCILIYQSQDEEWNRSWCSTCWSKEFMSILLWFWMQDSTPVSSSWLCSLLPATCHSFYHFIAVSSFAWIPSAPGKGTDIIWLILFCNSRQVMWDKTFVLQLLAGYLLLSISRFICYLDDQKIITCTCSCHF